MNKIAIYSNQLKQKLDEAQKILKGLNRDINLMSEDMKEKERRLVEIEKRKD